MKKLCIFDFDGTLVDTFTDAGIYYNKALEAYGFKTHNIEEYKYLMGGSLEEVVTRILEEKNRTEENINNVKKHYWDNYPTSSKENTKAYPGIQELLEELQKNNVKIAINTNKKQVIVDEMVKKIFPNINFVSVAGQNGKYPAKPDPEGVYQILKMCDGIEKNECIYIGDSKYDFETAQNAGIDAILVTWGAYKKELEEYSCVKVIANIPNDILKIYK